MKKILLFLMTLLSLQGQAQAPAKKYSSAASETLSTLEKTNLKSTWPNLSHHGYTLYDLGHDYLPNKLGSYYDENSNTIRQNNNSQSEVIYNYTNSGTSIAIEGLRWCNMPMYKEPNYSPTSTIFGDESGWYTNNNSVFVWDSPQEALANPNGAALELDVDDDYIDLKKYLGIQILSKDVNSNVVNVRQWQANEYLSSTSDPLGVKNYYGKEEDYGLHYEFELVDYRSGYNIYESRYATFTDTSINAAETGATSYTGRMRALTENELLSITENTNVANHEPLVRVLVKNESGGVVLDGYVLIHLNVRTNNSLNITSLYFNSSKFDSEYSNTVTVATTWNQFSKVVLQDALNMTSSTFDDYYMADCMGGGGPVKSNDAPYVTKYAYPITQNGKQGYQLKVFNFGSDIYGNTGTPPSVGTANEETSNSLENKELGTAIYYPHGEGTGKHIFSWTLSHEELTFLLGSSSSITITRWIRFAAKNSNFAPYPYIWIKLTMEVTKYTPTFTEGFEFYGWPIVSGETPLEDTVLNNVFVYIRKGQVYQDMCINPSKTITLIDGWNDEIKYREGKLEYYPDFALPEEYGGADPNLKAYIIRWNPAIEPHEFDGKPFLARVVFPEASFGNEVYGQWLNGEDVKESDCIVNGRIGMTFNIDNNRATQTTTYSLNITSSGNGSANYNGTTIRNRTNSFTVDEGANATILFNPDNGYRIKSVWVNNSNVTNSVYSNQYIISDIRANTTLSVEFEAIPASTYSLSITASGNGSATYNGTSIRNRTTSFTVDDGTSATITFTPDNGYRIKSVKENNTDVTSYVSNGGYTINSISKNTTIEVEFEAIPVPTYSLSITATGNGSVTYNGTAVRNQTHSFTVDEGTSATITFTPDNGNSIASVKLNNSDITSQVSSNSYTINNITANTTLSVTFQEDVNALTVDGLNYTVTSQSNRTVTLTSGDSGQVLTVPATITQNEITWKVTGIDKDALKGNTELAAIIWNPEAAFTATVSNSNLLLYVKSSDYAPAAIQNVVVNGTASNIVLAEAKSGNNFYCPQSFVAQKISYTHNYQMQTGIGEARGWETIALPFDVQTFTHDTKGEIKPFAQWKSGDATKPFWLMELTGTGFVETGSIKAYTPYIISMPNNPQYDSQWLLNGKVTFVANSVTIGKTEDLVQPTFNGRTFIPCFAEKESSSGLYALNVNNDFETNNSGMTEGSWFVLNKRNVHPFEAYMTSFSSAPQHAFGVFEDMTTGIQMMINGSWTKEEVVYDLQGRKVNAPSKKGVYIVNGKKKIIK